MLFVYSISDIFLQIAYACCASVTRSRSCEIYAFHICVLFCIDEEIFASNEKVISHLALLIL